MAGVCILGMGDCTPDIKNIVKNVNTSLSENIKSTMMNLTSNTAVLISAKQNYAIGDIISDGCTFDIGPSTQTMQVSINSSQVTKVMTEEDYNQKMTTAVASAVSNDSSAKNGFMSSGANITNTTENFTTNVNRVVRSFNYSAFQSLMASLDSSQSRTSRGFTVKCYPDTPINPKCGAHYCIGEVNQDMVVNMITSQITDTMTKEIQKILTENQQNLTNKNISKTESTGFFQDLGGALGNLIGAGMMGIFAPVLIVIAIVIAIGIAVFAYRYFTAAPAGQATTGVPMDPNAPPMDPNTPPMDPNAPMMDEMPPPSYETVVNQDAYNAPPVNFESSEDSYAPPVDNMQPVY